MPLPDVGLLVRAALVAFLIAGAMAPIEALGWWAGWFGPPLEDAADGRDAIAVGVSVKIPLQRKRIRAREEEARVRKLQVQAQREALESSIRTMVDDLVYRLDRTREQISLFETALIPQAESTLQATLITYSTGRSGFLDLLDAQRMLFELSWAREEAITEFDKAGVALQRALGQSLSTPSASNTD